MTMSARTKSRKHFNKDLILKYLFQAPTPCEAMASHPTDFAALEGQAIAGSSAANGPNEAESIFEVVLDNIVMEGFR